MNKAGPIVIIEDDVDDKFLMEMVLKELGYPNEVLFYTDGHEALDALRKEDINPFIILSDVNLPKLSGFELRKMIHTNDELSKKCIPYLFFSTSVDRKAVYDAYTLSVQGIFLKPDSYERLRETVRRIVEYWQFCYSPNKYDEEG